jgi:cystinosin
MAPDKYSTNSDSDSGIRKSDMKIEVKNVFVSVKVPNSLLLEKNERILEVIGVLLVIGLGLLLGFCAPESHSDVPPPWDTVISIMGWTYFSAWSISFYPQMILNWARKSVVGLSFDYQVYNILAYSCYSVYNGCFYWNKSVQRAYRRKHNGSESQVALSDVFFAVHGFAITCVILWQIYYYERGDQKISKFCLCICALAITAIIIFASIVLGEGAGNADFFNFLNFLYMLSYIKLGITLIKYFPQALLNCERQSTVGCNIHNFILDFTGGALSVATIVLSSGLSGDWSGITGDLVKFLLGLTSMLFDLVFFIQHYCLYKQRFDPFLAGMRTSGQLATQLSPSQSSRFSMLDPPPGYSRLLQPTATGIGFSDDREKYSGPSRESRSTGQTRDELGENRTSSVSQFNEV